MVSKAKINVEQNANVVESVHANFESQTHASNRDGTIKNMNGNRKNYKQQNWCLIEIKMITRFGNIVAYHRIRLIKNRKQSFGELLGAHTYEKLKETND